MNSYDFRFTVRFMIGGGGGFAGMMVCVHYGLAMGGKHLGLVIFSVLPFVNTLLIFGEARLRPFREFRKGLRVAVPDWDWGRDIATSIIASAIGAGLWLGTVAILLDLGLMDSTAAWALAGGLLGGTAYGLSRIVCKALGLVPPPLKPGWGE